MIILPFKEEWTPLTYPGVKQDEYEVSNIGTVRCSRNNIIFEPYISTNGNIYIALEDNSGILQMFMLSNIVAFSFGVLPDKDLVGKCLKIHYINGNHHDVRPDNIKWVEDIEEWRDLSVLGYTPNLWDISSHGRIYGHRYDKMLTPRPGFGTARYLRIGGLAKDGKHGIEQALHRLVAGAFVENTDPEKYIIVNHLDGNGMNDHYLNLEWADLSLNAKHAVYLGRMKPRKGETCPCTKITETDVRRICVLLLKYNGKINDVSRDTGIDVYTIRAIRNGASWVDIANEYFEPRHFIYKTPSLSDEKVSIVKEALLANDMNVNRVTSILSDLNISKGRIAYIKRKLQGKI